MQTTYTTPITHVAATICKCLFVDPPLQSEGCMDDLAARLQALADGAIDRVVVYNPDAIAAWAYRKYASKFDPIRNVCAIEQPMRSVIPPKTPVCFASMYSGASPAVHGIQRYTKPTLTIDTAFDALIRAGKKACIVTVAGQSMDRLFRNRDMDYDACKNDAAVIDRALERIAADEHDLICVYNQEYDDVMHVTHPNSLLARRALDHYAASFARLAGAIRTHWRTHNTVVGCATDHGTHREWYLLGNHGKDIPQDMQVMHLWGVIPRVE